MEWCSRGGPGARHLAVIFPRALGCGEEAEGKQGDGSPFQPHLPMARMRRRGVKGAGYSITSSARSSTEGGIVSPRALSVLRLITSSMPWSAGFSPMDVCERTTRSSTRWSRHWGPPSRQSDRVSDSRGDCSCAAGETGDASGESPATPPS
jgi:hypothetical protein